MPFMDSGLKTAGLKSVGLKSVGTMSFARASPYFLTFVLPAFALK